MKRGSDTEVARLYKTAFNPPCSTRPILLKICGQTFSTYRACLPPLIDHSIPLSPPDDERRMDHVELVADLIKWDETRAGKLRAIQSLLAKDPDLISHLRRIPFPPPPDCRQAALQR